MRRRGCALLLSVLLFVVVATILNFRRQSAEWRDSQNWTATQSSWFSVNEKSGWVSYGYVVDGKSYRGSRVHFFATTPAYSQRFKDWLAANRNREQVTVYYNPQSPQRSVLVRDAQPNELLTVVGMNAVIVVITIALPMLIFGWAAWWLWRQFAGVR